MGYMPSWARYRDGDVSRPAASDTNKASLRRRASHTEKVGWAGSLVCAPWNLLFAKCKSSKQSISRPRFIPSCGLANFDALTFAGAPPKTLANSILGADPGLERGAGNLICAKIICTNVWANMLKLFQNSNTLWNNFGICSPPLLKE